MTIRACLDEQQLAAMAAGDPAIPAELWKHVDECETCAAAIGALRGAGTRLRSSAQPEMRCVVCHASYSGGQRFCPVDGGAIIAADANADPLIGRMIDERYLVLRLIGRGGMGAVYEADHVGLDRRIALKFVSDADADRKLRARFRQEARAASRVVHSNVVQIFDVGTDGDGRDFIAMELIAGSDLGKLLESGPFAVERAVAITRQVLEGLHAIHGAGIIHRDIKPANIVLVRGDDVKIMDFGLSKSIHANAVQTDTATGKVVGTLQYMSPEQLTGDVVDARSDLYAVGVTLFAMLAGQLPFKGSSTSYAAAAVSTLAPRVDAIRPDVPAVLVDIVARALAKSPADRFSSARAFSDALDALAPGRKSAGGEQEKSVSAERIAGTDERKAIVGDRDQQATAFDRPNTPLRGRHARLWVGAVMALAVVGIAIGVYAWRTQTAKRTSAPSASEKLSIARAAESRGDLVVALEAYRELNDQSPDTLYRMGDLYERLGDRANAAAYLRRYVAVTTSSSDRASVLDRIARLEQSLAPAMDASTPDAGVPTPADASKARATNAQPAVSSPSIANAASTTMTCYCRTSSGRSLCKRKQPPLCHCLRSPEHSYARLCPTPFTACETDCPMHGSLDFSGTKWKCSAPYLNPYVRAVPGSRCSGYSENDVTSDRERYVPTKYDDGTWSCSFCTRGTDETVEQYRDQFERSGAPGSACTGYEKETGAVSTGTIQCQPRDRR